MRKYKFAFTMLELIFVIIVIAILSAVIIPRTANNKVAEAAVQLVTDIRLAQHLALIDDKYDPNDEDWYRKIWQIKFSSTVGSDNQWAYAIFADKSVDGVPNNSEVAVNPLDGSKILTGGYSSGTTAYNDAEATKKMNLGHKYGITSITMTGGCNITDNGSKRIAFDYQGRLLYGPLHNSSNTSPYNSSTLVYETCKITLSNGTESIEISIEPETGYTHISS